MGVTKLPSNRSASAMLTMMWFRIFFLSTGEYRMAKMIRRLAVIMRMLQDMYIATRTLRKYPMTVNCDLSSNGYLHRFNADE